jgi:hypothetical protein
VSPALAARKRRIRLIRRRIVATSLTTFAMAWAAIFFQLVIGDDPGLAQKHTSSPVAAAKSTKGEASSQKPKSSHKRSRSSSASSTSSTTASSSPSPAPVTTSQS